jgi:hypothetical protein
MRILDFVGLLTPHWLMEQTISHCLQPVHFFGSTTSCLSDMDDLLFTSTKPIGPRFPNF